MHIRGVRSLKQQYPAVVKISVVVYRYNLDKLVTIEKRKEKDPVLIRQFVLTLALSNSE